LIFRFSSDVRARARDLGIRIGRLSPGRWNAITDVAGVRVGHTTLIAGEGIEGRVAHAISLDRLREVMRDYRRLTE
jgi:hypothetical protein